MPLTLSHQLRRLKGQIQRGGHADGYGFGGGVFKRPPKIYSRSSQRGGGFLGSIAKAGARSLKKAALNVAREATQDLIEGRSLKDTSRRATRNMTGELQRTAMKNITGMTGKKKRRGRGKNNYGYKSAPSRGQRGKRKKKRGKNVYL